MDNERFNQIEEEAAKIRYKKFNLPETYDARLDAVRTAREENEMKLPAEVQTPEPSFSVGSWLGSYDKSHAELAQEIINAEQEEANYAETNKQYDITGTPVDFGKEMEAIHEKAKDTMLYAKYLYSPEDWAEKGKEIFDETGIDVNTLNDKATFEKAWNLAKETKKKKALYTDENGHVDMDKVYEAMPYLRDIREAHGTNAAVMVMQNAKELKTINDIYDTEWERFYHSVGQGAWKGALAAGNQFVGAKAMLRGILTGERMTKQELNDLQWFANEMAKMPEYSYGSAGGALGGVLGSAAENAPIMLPEMGRQAAKALFALPTPLTKALGVLTYGLMSTQIAGSQYVENVLKTDDEGRPIYTPRQAALLSIGQGAVEAYLEKRSIGAASKAIFTPKEMLKLTQVYSGTAGKTLDDVTRETVRNIVKERVQHGFKAGILSGGAELEEEFEQAISDRVLENMAQVAFRGEQADVTATDKILSEAFDEAVQAIPAVVGFGVLGAGTAVVTDSSKIVDARKRFMDKQADTLAGRQIRTEEHKAVVLGVADNMDSIQELNEKAPDVVKTILDERNTKMGIERTEVDIKDLMQSGNENVVEEVREKTGKTQEEITTCLEGSGRLSVETSILQMSMAKMTPETRNLLSSFISSEEGYTDRENLEYAKLLSDVKKQMEEKTDEEQGATINNFVAETYKDKETQELARDIISSDVSNPKEEAKRRVRDNQKAIDDILKDTIDTLKREAGQGVTVVQGEDGRGTRVSNNPQWYQNWYADHEKPPTQEDYERIAYENIVGEATRYQAFPMGDVTPEMADTMAEIKANLDSLFKQREQLKEIATSLNSFTKGDFLAVATMTPEAREAYGLIRGAFDEADLSPEARKAKTAWAILGARIVARVADAYRKAGKNVSVADLIPKIGGEQGDYNQMVSEMEEVRKQYEGTDKWLKAPNGEDSNLTEFQWLQVRTPSFKRWFGDWENDKANASKVLDENGEPLVVYHGTVSGWFDTFKKEYGNIEGNMGAGFYFTSSRSDVAENYEDGGADFENKVAQLAEQIQEDENFDYEEAEEKAREQLYKESALYDVYLNMRNPARVLGPYIFSDEVEVEELSEDDYEDEDDFYSAQSEATDEAWQDKIEAILDRIEDEGYEYSRDDLSSIFYDAIYEGGIGIEALREKLNDLWIENDEGKLATSEILRLTIEELGYDGILDESVSQKFSGMHLSPDTVHYIVFESNQIKSASENSGAFSADDDNIYHQFAGINSIGYDREALKLAKELENLGKKPPEIYKKTGWIKGKDNGWRYEIKDNLDKIDLSKTLKRSGAYLHEVYENDELFSAYPQIANIKVTSAKMGKKRFGETLIYDDGKISIRLNKELFDDETEMKSTLVHEIAHVIQAQEKFSNGASPEDVREYLKNAKMDVSGSDESLYRRLGGEQEAREVEARAKANTLLAKKEREIAAGDTSKKAKFARGILARAANRMPTIHKADAIILDEGLTVAEKFLDDFFQSAWHGTPHKFDSFDLGKIGTGEGAQAHGWGLYFAQSRDIAAAYRDILGKDTTIATIGGEKYDIDSYDFTEKVDEIFRTSFPKEYDRIDLREGVFEGLEDLFNEYGIVRSPSALREIKEYLAEEVEQHERDEEYERLVDIETMGRLTKKEKMDLYSMRWAFARERIQQAIVNQIESVSNEKGGALFEVDIPNDDVMLDEQKEFKEQPSKVKEAVRRCLRDIFPSKYNNSDIADMFLSTADSKYRKLERSISGMLGTISQMEDWLEYFETGNWTPTVAFSMDDDKKSVIQKFRLYPLNVKESVFHLSLDKFISANYDEYAQELAKVPQEEIDAFDVKEALREGIEKRKKEIDKETKEINKFFEEGFDKWFDNFTDGLTGKELYRFLDECMGSDKNASILLNDYGVEGIAYVGHRDGRCFVVFNDTAINIINTYNQKATTNKGSYSPTKNLISLFEMADQSTYMHEMAHFYVTQLRKIAEIDSNSPEAKEIKTIDEWGEWHKGDAEAFRGTQSYREFSKYEEALIKAQKEGTAELDGREYTYEQLQDRWKQEKFARAFEKYLQAGEAPTKNLTSIFRKFKKWLEKIYEAFVGAGVAPSSDIKAIMDRMVATDNEIQMAMLEREVNSVKKVDKHVFDKDTEELHNTLKEEAQEEAKEKLLKILLKEQKEKDIEEHMKAFAETEGERLTHENAFVVQEIINQMGVPAEEAINGLYDSVEAWQKDLEAKGGSYENALNKSLEAERERYKQELPDEEALTILAREELLKCTDKLVALEAEILKQKESKRNKIPENVTKALKALAEAIDIEDSDNPLEAALMKLRYAQRWGEKQQTVINQMQKKIDRLKEIQKESKEADKAKLEKERKHLRKEIRANVNAFKKITETNTAWLKAVRDASKGRVKMAKAYAEQELEEMPIKESTNEKLWIREARRNARAVLGSITKAISKNKAEKVTVSDETAVSNTLNEQAGTKGQSEAQNAYRAKLMEELNVQRAKAASKLKRQKEKILKDFKKITTTINKDKKGIYDASTRYYYNHLLYMVGLRKRDGAMPVNLVPFKEIVARITDSYTPDTSLTGDVNISNNIGAIGAFDIPQWIENLIISDGKREPDDYKEYRMSELRDIHTVCMTLFSVGNTERMNYLKDKNFSEIIKELSDDYNESVVDNKKNEANKYFLSLVSPMHILNALGDKFKHYVYDTLAEATENETRMQQQYAELLKNLFDRHWNSAERRKMRQEKNYVAPNGEKISKENILTIALNWGNKGNRIRAINTFLTADNAETVEADLIKLMESVLTENDWNAVQEIWNAIKPLGQKVNEEVQNLTGKGMHFVKPDGFIIRTADGKTIELKGGYYPIKYDYNKSIGNAKDTLANEQITGGTVFNTGMGSTKERNKEGIKGNVIDLSVDTLFNHVDKQIHIICMRSACRDAYRILASDDIAKMCADTIGVDGYRMLQKWVEDIWAQPLNENNDLANLLEKMRRNTVTAVMAYRTSTALLNFANPIIVAREIGIARTLRALASYYSLMFYDFKKFKDIRKWVKKESPFMMNRAHNLDRDFKRTQTDMFDEGNPVRRFVSQHAVWLIEETDLMTSIPVYYDNYQTVYNAELTKGTSEKEARKIAHRSSEDLIRKVFGSSDTVDQSVIQRSRNGIIKAITPFYTFVSTQTNAVFSRYLKAKYRGEPPKGEYAKIRKLFMQKYWACANAFLWTYVLQTFAEQALRDGIALVTGDDKKDKKYWSAQAFARRWAGQSLQTATAAIPIVNVVGDVMASTIMGQKNNASRSFGMYDAAFNRMVFPIYEMVKDKKNRDIIEIGRTSAKAVLGTGYGAPDTFVDGAFNAARVFTDHYSGIEWLRKSLFDKSMKKHKKGK